MESKIALKKKIKARVEVDKKTGCWLWQGSIAPNGYARMSVGSRTTNDKKVVYVHRLAFEVFKGKLIPPGWTIDHVRARGCRHRHCVNPAHLEAVTISVNLLRGRGWSGRNAAKTHCSNHHPFKGRNLIIDNKGARRCRECINEMQRRRRARLRS